MVDGERHALRPVDGDLVLLATIGGGRSDCHRRFADKREPE